MEEPRQLTVPEAAERLGLTDQQVYRRISRGDLAATTILARNPQFRLAEDEVERYKAAGLAISPTRPNPSWVTTTEAARRTGMSQAEIRRMCNAGELASRRGPSATGAYKIHVDSLRRFTE